MKTLRAVVVAEEPQDAQRLLRQRFHRAEQRRLLVERLAGPAEERGRDDQRRAVGPFEDEGGAGRVPGGVAAGLEGGADAAGGKRTGVRLAADQFLAAELGDRLAVAGRGEEAVVLLGGQAGHRLEEVREVGRALLDGPVLHGRGDRVGDRGSSGAPCLIVFCRP